MKLCNAVLVVVSHPRTFKSRTKRIIRVAYKKEFGLTIKQRPTLDLWETGDIPDDEIDEMTEEAWLLS
jgi:hypothetical protein